MNSLFLLQTLTLANALIVAVLVIINQPQTDSSFGSKDSFIRTRRGLEQTIHRATVLFSTTMVLLSIALHIFK